MIDVRMAEIKILPQPGHIPEQDADKAMRALWDAGIRCHQSKTLNRMSDVATIVLDSDGDLDRALSIVESTGARIGAGF